MSEPTGHLDHVSTCDNRLTVDGDVRRIAIAARMRPPRPPTLSGSSLTVLLLLLAVEGLTLFGVMTGWPVLGDYYDGYSGIVTQLAFFISCACLLLWYWINRAPPSDITRAWPTPRPLISTRLVWCVLIVNTIATLTFGYGSVGYTGTASGAFLLTAAPLEPLLFPHTAQQRRFDPALMFAYAFLGLVRGWTGHLFFIFLIYLLLSNKRQRRRALIGALACALLVFEPLMQLRALIRGFDDGTGLLAYRLASRLAFTPISDYVLNNISSVAFCNGAEYMPWYLELLFSVVPRALFGIQGGISIHTCLAVLASSDPATVLSFSTPLPIKAGLVLENGLQDFIAVVAVVSLGLYVQVRLAKRLLGSYWYVYTGIFQYQFFLSGVMRDLAIPTYLLVVMLLIRWLTHRKTRKPPAADLPRLCQSATP